MLSKFKNCGVDKELQMGARDLCEVAIPVFVWSDWENVRKISE
jgi:hypothetical protein